jgi:hypothetical protein
MSYFKYWFDNVVSTARLIYSSNALSKAWIDGDSEVTSAYDVTELLEQLLGDLRFHEHVREFGGQLREIGVLEQFIAFGRALDDLKKALEGDPTLERPAVLLTSPAWHTVQDSAAHITHSLAEKGLLE